MPETLSVEERLSELERAVAELQRRLPAGRDRSWLEHIAGSITDVEAFDAAMEIGRQYRRTEELPQPAEDQP